MFTSLSPAPQENPFDEGDKVTLCRRADPDDWTKTFVYIPARIVSANAANRTAEVFVLVERRGEALAFIYTFSWVWLEQRCTQEAVDALFVIWQEATAAAAETTTAR